MAQRARLAVVLTLAVGLWTSGAQAQQVPQAELDARVLHGIELRDAGQADAAIEHLRRVWETTHYPRALAQLAVTEQTLGRWTEADRHFREVLALASHTWVQQNRSRVEQSLAVVSEHIGELEITGVPPGTEVWVDEQRVATMPVAASLRLTIGTHSLELRAEGFERFRRRVDITPHALTRETVVLVRAGTTDLPAPAPQVVVVERGSGSGMRVAGWVSVGLAAVGVGVGVTGLLMVDNVYQKFDNECSAGGYNGSACRGHAGDINRWSLMAGAGFGAAGALTFAGIALLVLAPPHEQAHRAWVGCAPGLSSVQCTWRF